MVNLNITVNEKSVILNGSEEVFDSLFSLPPWKLPHIQMDIKPKILGCFIEICEKATKELVPIYQEEYKKSTEEFDKKLKDTGHVENELTQDVMVPGHFKITRSVRIHAWKFDVQVCQINNEYSFTLISAEFKPKGNRNFLPPQVSKKSLERDLSKNRPTAGNKKLDMLVKQFSNNDEKLTKKRHF